MYLLLRRFDRRVFLTDFLGNEQHLSEYLLEHLAPYQHDLFLSIKYAVYIWSCRFRGCYLTNVSRWIPRTRWRHIFSHVSQRLKEKQQWMTMSNPAIQNNVNDIKNSIVNIYEIHYTFSTKYLSNFISHLDQIYIYIYSFHIFYHAYDISSSFVHKHTHTPPKNKILFFLHPDTRKGFVSKLFIHYKNFKKKKKTKKQNKFEKHFFSLDLLSEEYYLTLENFQQMKMLLKKNVSIWG